MVGNYKHRVVDAYGHSYFAREGQRRLPSGVKRARLFHERRSGATFGYVGEWHSHPNGPCGFGATDFEEFANKAEEMKADGAAKPILEVLVSPVGLTCAVLSLC